MAKDNGDIMFGSELSKYKQMESQALKDIDSASKTNNRRWMLQRKRALSVIRNEMSRVEQIIKNRKNARGPYSGNTLTKALFHDSIKTKDNGGPVYRIK